MTTRSQRYDEGLQARREVLGDEYVDGALAAADGFTEALQDYVTEFVWGVAWTRPGLDRRVRSLVNIGMLAARGQAHELKAHTRGALRNGCSPEEIQEVLLQVAMYAGTPAAVDGFRVAHPVVKEWLEVRDDAPADES